MTTFTPGDRFRIYGGRVAHVVKFATRFGSVAAHCGAFEQKAYANPADDRPLCKECARAMERSNR